MSHHAPTTNEQAIRIWSAPFTNRPDMEQATLLKMARLRTLAARQGKPFDVIRFASEREFAKATLKFLLEHGDEELRTAGRAVMQALDLAPKSRRAAASRGPADASPTTAGKRPATPP
jgi:hypothetical protein